MDLRFRLGVYDVQQIEYKFVVTNGAWTVATFYDYQTAIDYVVWKDWSEGQINIEKEGNSGNA